MADVFTLSYSPRKTFNSHALSSSPVLPSPSELVPKRRPSIIRSGSRAASIPLNSPISFTSASALLEESRLKSPSDAQSKKSAKSKGKDGSPELLSKSKVTKPRAKKPIVSKKEAVEGKPLKAPRKTAAKKDEGVPNEAIPIKPKQSRAKKVVTEEGEVKAPTVKKPRAKKATKDNTSDEPAKEKPARKPRAKKSEEGQTKISKGRVTKPSARGASEKVVEEASDKVIEGALEINSMGFASKVSKTPVNYGLVKAVKRRTNWSPPTALANSSFSVSLETEAPSPDTTLSSLDGKGFGDLLGNYGFAQTSSTTLQRKLTEEGGTRKRKMIELVKTAALDTTPKAKAPKKKARTITDLATSAYAEEAERDTTAEPAPLLQYFAYQDGEGNTGATKVPPQARTKVASKATKSKKDTFQAPLLLSPTSALKEVRSQDFVFGTSSQLAREESPTYLRDLHLAMQASNEVIDDVFDDPFDDPFSDSVPEPSTPTPTKVKRKTAASKGALWCAAARDTRGSLLEVEMVDLIDSPVVSRTGGIQEAAAQMLMEDEWHGVEKETVPPTPTKSRLGEENVSSDLQEGSPKRKSRSPSPKRTKVLKDTDVTPTQPSKKTTKPKEVEMPNFETYTTAQLAAKVASYRFKAVKSRTAMISLLEQCWEGMNRTALKDLATNTKSSSPKKTSKVAPPKSSEIKATSPKKPVGRPRKDSSVSTKASSSKSKIKPTASSKEKEDLSDAVIPLSKLRTPAKRKQAREELKQLAAEEIPDSSPRRQTKTPPRSLKPFGSISTGEIGSDLTPASDQATLFKHITRAIRALPPTSDSHFPNWQEKILMYDPIVIEDLTVWLNTGALGKTGWDAEVGTKEVKKWCEGRSICCLWKENLRGGARARY